jgi:hypothetical protein
MYSFMDNRYSNRLGYPIRLSPDQRMCAPPRGFSQLTTTFLAIQLLGIRRRPLFAWPYYHLPRLYTVKENAFPDPMSEKTSYVFKPVSKSQNADIAHTASLWITVCVHYPIPFQVTWRIFGILHCFIYCVSTISIYKELHCSWISLEAWGFEPQAYSLQSYRSTSWAMPPSQIKKTVSF